jgi:hypothetical protein
MGEDLGQKLADASEGDHLSVTADGETYSGLVTEAKRYKGSIDAMGMIESGEATVYLDLDADTIDRYDLPGSELKVHAKEPGHLQWRQPTASLYNPEDGEYDEIGDATDIRVD